MSACAVDVLDSKAGCSRVRTAGKKTEESPMLRDALTSPASSGREEREVTSENPFRRGRCSTLEEADEWRPCE